VLISTAFASHRVVMSGIQPTGIPHIGNWLGAIDQWRKLQSTVTADADAGNTDIIVCIADLHSITVTHEPTVLRYICTSVGVSVCLSVFLSVLLKCSYVCTYLTL